MNKSLKGLREARGVSIKELSYIISIPASTLSAYERGTRYPKFDNLSKLAGFYGMSIDAMRGVVDEQNSAKFGEQINDKSNASIIISIIDMVDGDRLYTKESTFDLYQKKESDKQNLIVRLCDCCGECDLNWRVIRWSDIKCIYPSDASTERIVVNATIDTSALDDDDPSYVKRMVDELYELNEKIDKIRLMDKDILDETENNLLTNQFNLMIKYADILVQRIRYAKNKK